MWLRSMSPPSFTYGHYRSILDEALRNNFRFLSFAEISTARIGDVRSCFLRHDCDNDLVAARDMARIEQEVDVKSTYFIMLRSAMYNALAPTSRKLVEEILSWGHHIGLHFDESVFAKSSGDEVCDRIDSERALLLQEFGRAVDVVSFHQPSQRILTNEFKIRCTNTYDQDDMSGIYYTSDSNLNFRRGDPRHLFESGDQTMVQLLIHPEWWTRDEISLTEKWSRMLQNNFDVMHESLASREAAFRTSLQIEVKPKARSS